jgi:hypothetical protein
MRGDSLENEPPNSQMKKNFKERWRMVVIS